MIAAFDATTSVVLPSGLRLNCVRGGAAHGPAVLMLHGLSDSSFSFSRVLPLMPPHLRYVVLDQRGHGASDRPARGYSMDDFATDALSVMDTFSMHDVVLVGHSMGSFVARRLAERAPHRISRLVVTGTAMTPRNPVLAELRTALDALSDPVSDAFVREFQMSCIHRPVPAAFLARVIQESRKVPARVWQAAMAGLWAFEPRWPITVPTVVIAGDKDAVFSRAEHTALFKSTERSAIHVEPDIGHSIHWEAPARFIDLAFGTLGTSDPRNVETTKHPNRGT